MPWDPSYATLLEEIDAQHRYFVDLLDRLENSCQRGDLLGAQALLQELKRYARFHFQSEEALMRAYEYPSENHLAEHERILSQVAAMLADPDVRPAKIRMFLYKWLTNHIQLEDTEVAKHVNQKRRELLDSLPVSSREAATSNRR